MDDNKQAPEKPEEPQSGNTESPEEAQPTAENPYAGPTESQPDESPANAMGPIAALQAIILKPNSVFARIKDAHNWSWVAFIFVAFFSVLPTWLYFNQIDMNWYSDMAIEMQMPDVSPAEKEQAKQLMLQQSIGSFTAFFLVIGIVIINAVFAFYLTKITQIDEDNVLGFSDWYGFTWWVSLPFAFFSILTTIILLLFGGPQTPPEYLSVFSLAFVLGLTMDSAWHGWAQGISVDALWVIYLTAVGVSQWTRLSTRQCTIIATAPFAIIWGVWALFLIF
ncbi:Yip1 family protein [Planctobacterium marinum]|uniref:Yip1 family protein n=1 Tax=Planctobacterium marinum TaxID=1631968 RepID=UPI001E63BD70|nr:Yip1 family protein [Planctobacterium marinum]MCC2605914.1 YIP1 family protein [Planctobacterium marinum]